MRWRDLHGASLRHAGRWQEEHVLTGSILSTWAVLGTAIRAEKTTRSGSCVLDRSMADGIMMTSCQFQLFFFLDRQRSPEIARLQVQKIPLVRAKLADGGAIVGVKVHHDRLQEVRYVLSALHQERSSKGSKASVFRKDGDNHIILYTTKDILDLVLDFRLFKLWLSHLPCLSFNASGSK